MFQALEPIFIEVLTQEHGLYNKCRALSRLKQVCSYYKDFIVNHGSFKSVIVSQLMDEEYQSIYVKKFSHHVSIKDGASYINGEKILDGIVSIVYDDDDCIVVRHDDFDYGEYDEPWLVSFFRLTITEQNKLQIDKPIKILGYIYELSSGFISVSRPYGSITYRYFKYTSKDPGFMKVSNNWTSYWVNRDHLILMNDSSVDLIDETGKEYKYQHKGEVCDGLLCMNDSVFDIPTKKFIPKHVLGM